MAMLLCEGKLLDTNKNINIPNDVEDTEHDVNDDAEDERQNPASHSLIHH